MAKIDIRIVLNFDLTFRPEYLIYFFDTDAVASGVYKFANASSFSVSYSS